MPNYKEAPEWNLCTPKEQKWLESYLEDGDDQYDVVAATKAAFNVPDDESAITYGTSVIRRKRIQKIIDFASPSGGLPTLEEFQREVWSTAKSGKDAKTKLDALILYADLNGWRQRAAMKPARPKDATGGDGSALKDIEWSQE